MRRRTFLELLGGLAMTAGTGSVFGVEEGAGKPFSMKFAPHPRQLPTAPKDYLGQLQFAYDLGFRAWEDNGMKRQSSEMQEKIGAFAKEKGITLGVMVISGGNGTHFSRATREQIAQLEKDMRQGVEVSKRTGQTWMTMIPVWRRAWT